MEKHFCVRTRFVASGDRKIPVGHGYALYSALCRAVPEIHISDDVLAIRSLSGAYADRHLHIPKIGVLTAYVTAAGVPIMCRLVGADIDVCGVPLSLGTTQIGTFRPRGRPMRAHMVAINLSDPPQDHLQHRRRYRDAIIRQLESRGIFTSDVKIGRVAHMGVGDFRYVGYRVDVGVLPPQDDIALQIHGVGGKRRMGCGIFL